MTNQKYQAIPQIDIPKQTQHHLIVEDLPHRWVTDLEGLYSASECGKVFTHTSNVNPPREIAYFNKPANRYTCSINGRNHNRSRVVLSAWTGIPLDSPLYCLHINSNPHDDSVENLRWDTQSNNLRDAVMLGKLPRQKLEWQQYGELIDMYSTGMYTQTQVAKHYGISQAAVSHIVRRHLADPTYYNDSCEVTGLRDETLRPKPISRRKRRSEQLDRICEQYLEGELSQAELAEMYGYHQTTISVHYRTYYKGLNAKGLNAKGLNAKGLNAKGLNAKASVVKKEVK